MNVLEVKDLTTGYGKTAVVRGVSLSVGPGMVIGIIGPNGAGKTTLIRSILGYVRPWSGRVMYRGVDITGLPAHKISKLGVGYVPERGGILRSLTVWENIELALRTSEHGEDRLSEVTKIFRIIDERRNQLARTLSGGEQRMLSIATAILTAKDLMILDEPSAGLAPLMRRKLAEALRDIRERFGMSLVIAEQDPTLVLELADTVYVIEMGSIVRSGKPQEVVKVDVLREHYLGM